MTILQLLMGIILLIAGRKIFWFLVGCVGFYVGMRLAILLFPDDTHHLVPVVAFACGIGFALLTIFFKKVAIGVAGFLVGAFITLQFCQVLGMDTVHKMWIFLIIGGAIGVAIFSTLFDLALIIFSSAVGALLILQSIPVQTATFSLLFIVLAVAGIVFQTKLYHKIEPLVAKKKS